MSLSSGTHGVIIVHGFGDQKKGDLLADFSKALCDTLIDSPEGGKCPKIQLKSDVSGSPPTVTLQITSPYGEEATWLCREAFWNDAFPPPQPTQVLLWALHQNLPDQLRSFLRMLRDPLNEDLPTAIEREKEEDKKKNNIVTTGVVTLSKKTRLPVRVKSGVVSGIVIIPLALLIYILLILIWLAHFIHLPIFGTLDKIIGWILKADPFISTSFGDVKRYTDHQIWSANARARLENIVIGMLHDCDIKDITIVAHSLGAVLAYDALTEGGNIAEAVAKLEASARKKITFITVGAGINRVFSILLRPDSRKSRHNKTDEVRCDDSPVNNRLAKVITGCGDDKYTGALEDKFFWLDIFARRDPVPAGPIAEKIVKIANINPKSQMKEREVINKDNVVFDHVSYWENKELVMPRIVRAINGGKEYPWKQAGITEEKVLKRIQIALRFVN